MLAIHRRHYRYRFLIYKFSVLGYSLGHDAVPVMIFSTDTFSAGIFTIKIILYCPCYMPILVDILHKTLVLVIPAIHIIAILAVTCNLKIPMLYQYIWNYASTLCKDEAKYFYAWSAWSTMTKMRNLKKC